MEAYFELAITCALSSRMTDIKPIWQPQDYMAWYFNVFFTIVMPCFTAFACWFVFYKINGLIALRKVEFLDEKEEFIKEVRNEYKRCQSVALSKRSNTNKDDMSNFDKMFDDAIAAAVVEEARLRLKAANVNEEDYEWYEPMFDGLDLRKSGAQFHHFNFVMRRVLLCTLALFWRDYPTLQMIGFMLLSLANAVYLIYADPLIVESFEDVLMGFFETMNEVFVMVQSYITMCILFSLEADDNYVMNEALTGVIRA